MFRSIFPIAILVCLAALTLQAADVSGQWSAQVPGRDGNMMDTAFNFKVAGEQLTVNGFAAPALQTMMQYAWPGNVRELEHTLERAVLMCHTAEIQVSDLGLNLQRPQGQNLEELSIEEVEGILVRKALQRFHGNVSQAAEALGLSRGALYRRMERYGL